MMWTDHDVSAWGYAWMAIGMVIFWALLIAVVVAMVRYLARPDRPVGAAPADRPLSPEQMLAERYARGEIDEDEYRRRLETLRASTSSGR